MAKYRLVAEIDTEKLKLSDLARFFESNDVAAYELEIIDQGYQLAKCLEDATSPSGYFN